MFVIGGVAEDKTRNEVYKLTCGESIESCKWEENDVKMKHARAGHVVWPISDSLATEICD